jgi:NADPH:quinone reductase-like Zn-dependent oxidoreductase
MNTMKAYTINRYSSKDKLEVMEVQLPIAKENEVLIQVHSAGLNLLDDKIKSGEFKLILPYQFPLILGHDLAGVVVGIGSKVTQFKVGDEVFARPADFHIGTFADYISVNENDLALKPKNISMDEAASLPLVALTVWQAFVDKGRLSKGEKVFIQAGSGGVGTIAVQIAKHLGAIVATTTSTSNFDLVKNLGADIIIDYKTQDFEAILKEYDLVLNSQDEKTLEKSLRILKPGGKVISISGPPDMAFAKFKGYSWIIKTVIFFLSKKITNLAKKLNVEFSFLFMQSNGKQLSEIRKLVEAGVVLPVVDKVFPIEQINEGMYYVKSGRARGKVVVKLR